MRSSRKSIDAFLKWAGGKRWLINNYSHLFPEDYNDYYEPFLGSGSVFFALRPKKSILSDINQDLVNTYIAIKENPKNVTKLLKKHHSLHCKEYYYTLRKSKPRTPASIAARLIYLNRTCWNGLYRVNKKGFFNVPIGNRTNILRDTDNFEFVSESLKNSKIVNSDFESLIKKAKCNDLIFADPPYTVKHNLNNFVKYNDKLFSWDDQVRLKDCLDKATSRGAKFIVTNADHESIHELYSDYSITPLSRPSTMAANSNNRGQTSEVIIKNW